MDRTSDHARFVAAVEAHPAVPEFRTHPLWGKCWTAEVIRQDPPLRVEFAHVTVLGTFAEAWAASQHKTTWGAFLGVAPLRPDDPLHPTRIMYLYKPSSPSRQGYERRQGLKRVLGRKARKLVTAAMRRTKTEFLQRLRPEDAQQIRLRLGLGAGDFWRACRQGGMWQGVLPLGCQEASNEEPRSTARMTKAQRLTCAHLARYLGPRHCCACQRPFTRDQMARALASVFHSGGTSWPLSVFCALRFFCRSYDLGHDRQCHPELEPGALSPLWHGPAVS